MKITEFAALINAYAEANPNLLVVGRDEYGDVMALSSAHLIFHKDNEFEEDGGYDNFIGFEDFDCCYGQEFTPEMAKDYHGLTFAWNMI